ncbi:MAG: hypothetical protein K2J16_01045 [Clostridia bacterium]|nr:hypothetical protein [Clostridia bacterium]
MSVTITAHADLRIKQRLGIKSKQRREIWANNAYNMGKRENECAGIERKALQELKLNPTQDGTLEKVLYQDRICIFCDSTLVTVYPKNNATAKIMEHRRAYNRGVRHTKFADCFDMVMC